VIEPHKVTNQRQTDVQSLKTFIEEALGGWRVRLV
jgi:hypothetical protein